MTDRWVPAGAWDCQPAEQVERLCAPFPAKGSQGLFPSSLWLEGWRPTGGLCMEASMAHPVTAFPLSHSWLMTKASCWWPQWPCLCLVSRMKQWVSAVPPTWFWEGYSLDILHMCSVSSGGFFLCPRALYMSFFLLVHLAVRASETNLKERDGKSSWHL